jgi:hypothetical protein
MEIRWPTTATAPAARRATRRTRLPSRLSVAASIIAAARMRSDASIA